MSLLAVYTFGVTKAEISANGDTSTPASWVNIPLIADGTVTYTLSESEVRDGDGTMRLDWFHSQSAKVSLMTKVTFFRLLEMATGSPVSSYQGGTDAIEFGTSAELNPPATRLRIQCRAQDTNTNRGYMEIVIYRARGKMGNFGMKEVAQGSYTVQFTAELAVFDELGGANAGAYGRAKAVKTTLA